MSVAFADPLYVTPLVAAARAFDVAYVEDFDRLTLQNRFDRKFVLRSDLAAELLGAVRRAYRIVLARNERFALYDTTYFDTEDLRFFHDHRRRRRPRVKVRIRNYVDRALSVLEIKEKTARGETRKHRWERPEVSSRLTAGDGALLANVCPHVLAHGALGPQVRTVFHRLMLLNAHSVERATLDFGVTLERGATRRTLGSLVLVEVKDTGRGQASPLVTLLRRFGAKPLSFSKYCVAIALLTGERANVFRPSLRFFNGGL